MKKKVSLFVENKSVRSPSKLWVTYIEVQLCYLIPPFLTCNRKTLTLMKIGVLNLTESLMIRNSKTQERLLLLYSSHML